MADILSPAERSVRMSAIRSKNTKPEVRLRRALFALGLRFRLHVRNLPGAPDLVFRRFGVLVNVRGCFWHQHHCRDGHIPHSRRNYWVPKLKRNVQRDVQRTAELRSLGWREIVVWECEIRSQKKLERMASRVAKRIRRVCTVPIYSTNSKHAARNQQVRFLKTRS